MHKAVALVGFVAPMLNVMVKVVRKTIGEFKESTKDFGTTSVFSA